MNLTLSVNQPEEIVNLIAHLDQKKEGVCQVYVLQEGVTAIKVTVKMVESFLITLVSDKYYLIAYYSTKPEAGSDHGQVSTLHMMPPSHSHGIDFGAQRTTEVLFFVMDAALPEMIPFRSQTSAFELPIGAESHQLIDRLFHSSDGSEITTKSILYSFLVGLLLGIDTPPTASSIPRQSRNSRDLQKVQLVASLIVKDFSVAIPSIAELALKVNMSKSKLKLVFARVYNKSLYGYYMDMRFEYAKRLLASKEYRVNEVSTMVGYENVTKFVETFRKRFGTTPKRFGQV